MSATVAVLRASRRERRMRQALIAGVVAAVIVVGFVLEVLCGGTANIPFGDIPPALLGNGDGLADFVIFQTREPRALTAVLAGALFALSGVLYQRLFSNVLATPDIIGVSAGASAGAVAVIVLGVTGIGQQFGAIFGAAAAAALIFALGWRSGAASYRLILVGIGIGACFSALTSYLILFTNDATSTRIMQWMIGSLSGVEWPGVQVLALALALGAAASFALESALETLRLGDPLAASLGTRVQLVRLLTLILGATLAAIATSVVGPISFIALVSGPIAALLFPGSGFVPPLLVGAAILVLSDLVAQTAPGISPVPTGIVTGIIGAPVLIFLLMSRHRGATR